MLYYEGITESGEKVSGSYLGGKDDLIASLKQKGIFLTAVKEGKKKLKKGRYSILQFSKDLEQISYLVGSGLQIDKALSTLIKNTNKKPVIDFWGNVLKGLRSGKQFSISIKDVAAETKLGIGEFYTNMISVAEEVGNLKGALEKVTENLQFRNNLIKEIRSALTYPAFVVSISLLVLFVVGVLILPRFSSLFTPKEMQALPLLSKVIINGGRIIHQNIKMVIIGCFILGTGLTGLFSFQGTRKFFKTFLFGLPYIKDVILQVEIANLCSSLGTMLDGGVDISRAISLSRKVVNSSSLRNILEETRQELKKGSKVSDIWRQHAIIPEDVVALVVVGENSAMLGSILIKLGHRYLQDFKLNISKLLTLLEPVLIIGLGVFVGLVVVAIMLAVVSLNNVAG